jgi:nicotinamide-nucleotide amidase
MKIEILCTGDEILTGKTINTNHSYISQRLTEAGLQTYWGTIVGDDRESLVNAFQQASQRADAVIVNGGLGPTVDDLSQEVAAEAAGVELELHEPWLQRLQDYYTSRGRKMPPNNKKQAMLPAGCEFIDNPIGTACGFAVNINGVFFYFTPGVPREMRRMIDEQVVPRILKSSGLQIVTQLKRFHSFGIGESRADEMLKDVESLAPNGTVKLGFQSHYPQLETKLAVRAANETELQQALAPIEAKVRECLGNFILCEDAQTLEQLVLELLADNGATLSIVEMTSGGAISKRLVNADHSGTITRRGIVSRQMSELASSLNAILPDEASNLENACRLADQCNTITGSSHSLVLLQSLEPIDDSTRSGADIFIAIATPQGTVKRQARFMGGNEWVQLGSVEMALDCLRRCLLNLPVDEKIDFEQQG